MFLGPGGEVEEYSVISIQQNSAISSDLILDQKEEHLFIMTHNMVYMHTHTHGDEEHYSQSLCCINEAKENI